MARRRRGGDALTIIFWRDIPAQVTATIGEATGKALLEDRFQHAIDRAASVAGLTETQAYVSQWRRHSTTPGGTDPQAVADGAAADLAARYPRDRLERLVAQGGAERADDQTDDRPSPGSDHPAPADRSPTAPTEAPS